MKATDLMIGDWVLWKTRNVQIVRTCALVYSFGHRDVWLAHCNDDNNVECHDMSTISPIPLTPEILEKNGFCFVKSSDRDTAWNGWWIYKGLELAVCCLDRNANWPCYINIIDSNIKCKYVHQLQHALRLCGLNELADNFKI